MAVMPMAIPVSLAMELVVARHVIVMVVVPHVAAGIVIVVAGVVPIGAMRSMPNPRASIPGVITVAAVIGVVATIVPAVRIPDVDMHAANAEVNSLRAGFPAAGGN